MTRAVAGNDALSVDTWEVRPETGDRILLCSDGVHGGIAHPDLVEIAGAPVSLDDACKRLLEKANQQGGADNATVVLREVKDGTSDGPAGHSGGP